MATILFGWELGGGHGHVQNLLRLARELAARGHQPVFAIRNLGGTSSVFRNECFPVLQAPFWHPAAQRGSKPFVASSYADVLAIRGFDDVEGLGATVRGWQSLIDLVRPDLIVCDFSPTLCLTAYQSLPVVMIGNGFALPPIEQPIFPTILQQAEPVLPQEALLEVVRAVQLGRGRAVPPTLPSLFAGERFVIVLPEIDPYRQVRRERCRGPIQPLPTLSPLPAEDSIFAYLSDDRPIIEQALINLAKAGIPTSTYLRTVSASVSQRLRDAGVVVHDYPQPLIEVLPRCRTVLHHASANTAQQSLAAGRAQVMWPQHLEQSLTGQAICSLGVGAAVPTESSADTISKAVISVSKNPGFAQQALRWGETLRQREFKSPLPEIVARCLALLN